MSEHSATNSCPNCGRSVTGQRNFCPYCGYDLRGGEDAPAPPRAVVEPPIADTQFVRPSSPASTDHEPPVATPPMPELRAARPPETQATVTGQSSTRTKSAKPKRSKAAREGGRFRLVDQRVMFGLLGLIDIPVIVILAVLLFRGSDLKPTPQSLVCDEVDASEFIPTRFASGLSGELDEDTLFSTGSEYLVQGNLVVPQNRRVLIQPGARVLFEEGAAIEVRGAFYACGSLQEPITFTSEAGEPGSWEGIRFINADESSTISHALIQFAGDRAVYLENSAPTLLDVKIASSSGFPISSDGNDMPSIVADVVLENNPFDGIEIRGGTTADKQNIVWPSGGFAYVISGPVEIGENTTLLIEPETTVKFWQPPQGNVPGLHIRGLLKAEDVRFTSVYDSRDSVGGPTYVEARDPAPGDWAGITFEGSSGKSYLRRSLVQYAGQGQGAISMQASSPELVEVTIADSAWYPLSADADSFPLLSQVTLTANDPGDAIEIRGGSAITGREQRTWGPLGDERQIVRVVRGNVTVEPEATLIIEPGVVIKFEPGSKLVIQGTLNAVGGSEEAELIVFTSLRDGEYGGDTDKNTGPQDPRGWEGIVFERTDESSILQNSIVRYGSIQLNDASPRLFDNLILEGEAAAIWATPGASPTLRNNELRDNGVNGLVINGGQMETDQTWTRLGEGDNQVVRVLTGNVTVAEGATLQIESGTVIKADTEGKLTIQGGLQVMGEDNLPVIFTSVHDDSTGGDTNRRLQEASAGDWAGIEAAAEADSSFAYVIIRYAQTGLTLRGGNVPNIGGWLRVTGGEVALWCDGRAEMPDAFMVEGNEDNYGQCPTQ